MAAAKGSSRSIPVFAGIALVDILANGVAVLIIIIVISIASRLEQEQRYAEQEEEVSAVMTRQFSTSLVLNRLAASPAARLHDYDNSPLDQVLDPLVLPIIEMHRDYVREFYTGTIWTRDELLQDNNTMDAWLAGFGPEQKVRLRIDLYDVKQFYLTVSILRDHGINPGHWHFLPGVIPLAQARRCPPGVSAADCLNLVEQDAPLKLPDLPLVQMGQRGGLGEANWPPPTQAGVGSGGAGSPEDELGPLPSGTTLGRGFSGEGEFRGMGEPGSDASGWGSSDSSFPNSQSGGQGMRGSGSGSGQMQGGIRLRLALPESQAPGQQTMFGFTPNSVNDRAYLLGAIMYFIDQAQKVLDKGGSPVPLLSSLVANLMEWIEAPPPLTDEQLALVHFLALDYELMGGNKANRLEQLRVHPVSVPEGVHSRLVLRPNRLLQDVKVGRGAPAEAENGEFPAKALPTLNLNAFPSIWRGLKVNLERGATVMMPPEQRHPQEVRWRAVAYVSPQVDDYIIGFVHASVSPSGALEIHADDNRVRLGGQNLITAYRESLLGSKGWLVILYAGLTAGLLALFLWRRLLLRSMP